MPLSDLNDTLTMVFTIGDGRPLEPLSARRASAAMPFGGSYRVIDFALTNCLHSGLRRIMVLTQYNALSLHNHIRDGWSIYNTDLGEYIIPVTPPIGDDRSIYAGNADALHKSLYLLEGATEDNVMVVSGEQIYRMDYAAVLAFHAAQDADVTIGCVPSVNANGAHFPVSLNLDGDHVAAVNPMQAGTAAASVPDAWWPMGVAVFRRTCLIDLLKTLDGAAPGPLGVSALVGLHLDKLKHVVGYRFGGSAGRVTQDRYWRRLDSLDDYYDANMDLLMREPPLDLYQANCLSGPTRPSARPAARYRGSRIMRGSALIRSYPAAQSLPAAALITVS